MNESSPWNERRFSDEELELASGLSVRTLRSLGSADLLEPVAIRRGRGRRRTYDHVALGRAILMGGLKEMGLPISLAAEIAIFAPFEDRLTRQFRDSEILDPKLSPLLQSDTDLAIDIVDEHFAFVSNKGGKSEFSPLLPHCFGCIKEEDDGPYFECWLKELLAVPRRRLASPAHQQIDIELTYTSKIKKKVSTDVASYLQFHKFSARDIQIASRRFNNPLLFCSINISMALRAGKARLLGIALKP